ncbi:YciI family protein [Qingshengfaniella alkalisoli]|uniref:YciI family protein n=1 Tax=Qingshengfaniella alkalisoli TaxID=2599296 RepID=A0A5B8IPL2_9RHOB|nr:YciI family protein [Qingshengfaniella alkalisoli]QDY68252.1 YciI family protein [Qingshengfaniella alkalisoli]
MPYALICLDKEGAIEVRKNNREAHLAYIQDTGVVAQAGPFLGDDGIMIGSLVILDVDDRAAAEHWAAGDPYAIAGLFQRVEIFAWKKVVG